MIFYSNIYSRTCNQYSSSILVLLFLCTVNFISFRCINCFKHVINTELIICKYQILINSFCKNMFSAIVYRLTLVLNNCMLPIQFLRTFINPLNNNIKSFFCQCMTSRNIFCGANFVMLLTPQKPNYLFHRKIVSRLSYIYST